MKKLIVIAGLALALILQYSCNPQSKGFALPQGDIENGKIAFVELLCNHCHSAGEIEFIGVPEEINLPLGGPVRNIKTYGELVTSIINPSHKVAPGFKDMIDTTTGESKMWKYNEVMDVQQLVDIVTFLQDEYEIAPPPAPYYTY